MAQLGHKSLAMLLRYSEVNPDEQASVMDRIDAA
jgi:hypothetical protein